VPVLGGTARIACPKRGSREGGIERRVHTRRPVPGARGMAVRTEGLPGAVRCRYPKSLPGGLRLVQQGRHMAISWPMPKGGGVDEHLRRCIHQRLGVIALHDPMGRLPFRRLVLRDRALQRFAPFAPRRGMRCSAVRHPRRVLLPPLALLLPLGLCSGRRGGAGGLLRLVCSGRRRP
jgi:hypothetical protein